MHEHVSKSLKIYRKPTSGTNKHRAEWKREGYAWSNPESGDASQMVASEQGLMGIGCNHTRSSPRGAPDMAKPRTRKANTSIKNRSKQA